MTNLLIVGQESERLAELSSELSRTGFVCSVVPHGNGFAKEIAIRRPNLVIVEMTGDSDDVKLKELIQSIKQNPPPPLMALVNREVLDSMDSYLDIDDFIISPYDDRELVLRIKRLLARTERTTGDELIQCDGLVIDLTRCEVTLEGKLIELTFKEYELLKFLAGNRGRVYSREALLDEVWGYDYFGGDRTVDVHVRRLRSKIEDSRHSFIETLRNIGYRFKKAS